MSGAAGIPVYHPLATEALPTLAIATNRFLSDDLLGRADPFNTGRTKELFADVVQRASPLIDRQFRTEPIIVDLSDQS